MPSFGGMATNRSYLRWLDCMPVAANTLHLSLASVWELQIKMQLGKIALRLLLADVLRDQQEQNGLLLEEVTLEDILGLSRSHRFIETHSTAL
jgi:PIN domain nuclease of toxin-antitoxin system